jgi:hypothetical protein
LAKVKTDTTALKDSFRESERVSCDQQPHSRGDTEMSVHAHQNAWMKISVETALMSISWRCVNSLGDLFKQQNNTRPQKRTNYRCAHNTWTNATDTMSERSQTQKSTCYVVSFIENSRTDKTNQL